MKIANLLKTTMAAILLTGCSQNATLEVMEFTNNLTPEEIAAGKFTPEVMWKMGRVGSQKLSPDGTLAAFTITYYNMAENKGTTGIYLMPAEGGDVVRRVDKGSSPQWVGNRLYYMADGQVWSILPDGSDKQQLTDIEGIESFGIAPTGEAMFYTKKVHIVNIKG